MMSTVVTMAPSAADILGLPGRVTGPAVPDRWGRLVVPLRLEGCPDVLAGRRRCPACCRIRAAVGTYVHFPLAGRPCRVRVSIAPCPHGLLPTPYHRAFLTDWGMTAPMFEHVAAWICSEPLAKVARHTGQAAAKLGHLLAALEAELAAPYCGVAARRLGIDGVHILGRTRTTIADLGATGRLVDLAEDHSPAAIRAALRRLKGVDSTTIIVIDMCAKLRAAVTEAVPKAEIRIDTTHIGRGFDCCLRDARRRFAPHEPVRLVSPQPGRRKREALSRVLLKKPGALTAAERLRLEAVFAEAPLLAEAYTLHDRLWRLLQASSRRAAEQQAAAIVTTVPPELVGPFRPALALLTGDWAPLLFNNFAGPRLTNNRTEALNRRVKEVWAEGRGNMSFPALRLKCLVRLGPFDAAAIGAAARRIATRAQPACRAEEVA